MERRRFLQLGVAATAGVIGAASAFELSAGALGVDHGGDGPYGPLGAADGNGIQLPSGFTAREIARADAPVPGTSYVWPVFPDGGATFPARGGGWTYVVNSEMPSPGAGGVSALRFSARGDVVAAERILEGTQTNCAGGATPWRTWLSGEEHPEGQVWECDPTGRKPGRALPALGRFEHEAAAVDPKGRRIYLTEDVPDGRFYRFSPKRYPSLDAGTLEVAVVSGNDAVTWRAVSDPGAASTPTREQVPESTPFNGGEGLAYHRGTVYFTTKGDDRVWAYDTRRKRLRVMYDGRAHPELPLRGVDNVTTIPRGDVLVAEDGDNLELVTLTADGAAAPLLRCDRAARLRDHRTGVQPRRVALVLLVATGRGRAGDHLRGRRTVPRPADAEDVRRRPSSAGVGRPGRGARAGVGGCCVATSDTESRSG